MFIQTKTVLILVMIFLGCSLVANENCDWVRFSSDDQKDLIKENFTQQSLKRNGKPVYYSVAGPKNQYKYTYIWWNNETWLSKTMTDSSNKITKVKIKISHQLYLCASEWVKIKIYCNLFLKLVSRKTNPQNLGSELIKVVKLSSD